jgi:hypothetical protein
MNMQNIMGNIQRTEPVHHTLEGQLTHVTAATDMTNTVLLINKSTSESILLRMQLKSEDMKLSCKFNKRE